MNTFAATLLLIGMSYGLPLWAALTIQAVVWLVMLAPHTWRDFLAAMNLYRVRRGGEVVLPADLSEVRVHPDAEWVVTWLLGPPGTLKNFVLAQIAAVVYFHVIPRPIRFRFWMEGWKVRYEFALGDVGLTKLLDRLVDTYTDWRHYEALAVRARWLSVYDPRGLHT